MTAETIRDAAYGFMKEQKLDQIDHQHDNELTEGIAVVESFIARSDDALFIPGSWVVGIHIADDAMWDKVKKGEINGFSMEALAFTKEVEVEIEIPPVVSGDTSKEKDHVHKFYVTYDTDGTYLGGKTDEAADGHFHLIKSGTTTNEASGHTHRFSAVDSIEITNVVR